MIRINIPSKSLLEKNYRKEFKYGAINIENDDQNVLKSLKIGKKDEMQLSLSFEGEDIFTVKGRISMISKKSFIFAFDNNDASITLKSKIENIIGSDIKDQILI